MAAAEQGWVFVELNALDPNGGSQLCFVHLCARARSAAAALFKRLHRAATLPSAPAPSLTTALDADAPSISAPVATLAPVPVSMVSPTPAGVAAPDMDLQVLERELQQISTALENGARRIRDDCFIYNADAFFFSFSIFCGFMLQTRYRRFWRARVSDHAATAHRRPRRNQHPSPSLSYRHRPPKHRATA